MTHSVIHRYRFSTAEVVDALGLAQDCMAWTVSIDAAGIIVDIVEPGSPPPEPPPSQIVPPAGETIRSAQDGAMEPSPTTVQPTVGEGSPELKGGPLAQRAAIACGEPGFQTFAGVRGEDEARADVCRRCGITSRKMLDHDERAAAIWRDIDGKYRLWLDGHDVEI